VTFAKSRNGYCTSLAQTKFNNRDLRRKANYEK
jgi:hypothetical protein